MFGYKENGHMNVFLLIPRRSRSSDKRLLNPGFGREELARLAGSSVGVPLQMVAINPKRMCVFKGRGTAPDRTQTHLGIT